MPLVTFTGIDRNTDLDLLARLQRRYPLAEFGVLISMKRSGMENRYLDMALYDDLCRYDLNLSLHLCGSIARNALQTNFSEVARMCGTSLYHFRRIQINGLSEIEDFGPVRATAPAFVKEIIIQQNPNKKLLTDDSVFVCGARVSYLYDGSGGLGKETPFCPLVVRRKEYLQTRVGYAGGINPDNVLEKWHEAKGASLYPGMWIDMESGVRTDDWFDLDKVKKVLKQMFPLN